LLNGAYIWRMQFFIRVNLSFVKSIVFVFGLLFPFMNVQAQTGNPGETTDGSLYYYFGAQKISLSASKSHIYIETIAASNTSALEVGLQTIQPMAGAEMHALATATRGLITLTNTAGFDSVLAWIKQQPGVVVARPAVYHQKDKDHLYEEAFYVKLKPGTTTLMLQNEAAKTGCTIIKPYDYDKRVYVIHAGANANFDGLQMANRFYETGLFEYAEPDFRSLDLLHKAPPPNDYLFPLQWGLKNTGIAEQFNGTPGADISIEQAWQVTRGSANIRIAVIDEGVERSHPDLINNIDSKGFGLVASVGNTGAPLSANLSHGTSCAGIIAAEANNGIGIAGVAPLCKIIPVNLTINTAGSFGTSAQLATCIDWSWNQGGADILSNSWGGGLASSLIHDAIKRATTQGRGGKGAIVLFSSGNNDAGVSSPSIFPETISVGAMDMCYQRKSINTCDAENFWGSNYGFGLDVSAPGVKIATTVNSGYTETFNGTSAACPFASGVAALILSVNPNYSQGQVREILERSARKVGNNSYSRVPGQPHGSWSPQLGYGMVNAHQAVLAAQHFDFACKVSIKANGPVQFCTGGSVTLQVNENAGNGLFSWLRNGVQLLQTATSLSVNSSGLYQAIILRPSGCRDTSIPIEVRVPPENGTLMARAGRDTSICTTVSHVLGGSPSATGGTAALHTLRGMALNGATNEFIRFDPQYPSEFFKIVKSEFNPDANTFYSGAAITPTGLYMIARNNKFVKVDTATGQVTAIGTPAPQQGTWNGMTYNPVQQKTYAVASNGASNQLYEMNERTGIASLLGTISGASSMLLVWIASDANGDMFAMRLASSGSAQIFKINLNPLSLTALPNGTGFQTNYQQDAEFDFVSGKLLVFAVSRPLGSSRDYPGRGLWEANKITGTTTLIGSVAQPFNWLDALAFSGPEYKYSWSPATYLSNPNDANPVFSGAPPGVYTYTLTVTDLCGQTAQSTTTITVRPTLTPNANGVLFVNAAATGNGTGSSWENAVPTLQQALLNFTNTCGTITQIWVAKGTYKPTPGANREIAFTMRNNLAIYGGFAGTETQLSQRNIRSNPSILSGEIGLTATTTDNSYNVVRNDGNGLNSTARLDGFTIVGGYANKGDYVGSRGAGIFNRGSSPTYANCIMVGNLANAYGGGMFSENGAPLVINSVLAGNTAQFGGGLYNESATTNVINCTFAGNQVTNTGGAFYSFGTPIATIRNSIIWGNSSGIQIATVSSSNAVVTNSLVQGGYATGTNIINVNPLFIAQPNPGLGNIGDLRLQPCSPAINAGINTDLPAGFNTDVTGAARIASTTIDMGAYERQILTQPTILYVNANATGGNDGSNWTNAFTKLQDALQASRSCGSIRQIWVARGTYYPDEGQGITNNNRNESFRLRDTLAIYGGFAGTETSLSQRNLALLSNASILSGEIQQDGNNSNNTIQVVVAANLTSNNELDGFTIQGGFANIVLPEIQSKGAGLFVTNSSLSLLRNLTITENDGLYGAAITVVNSNPQFVNCVVQNNRTSFGNGAIWNDNSFARYFHCTIANNINTGAEQVVLKITGNTSPQVINAIVRGTSSSVSGGNPFIIYSNIQHSSVWPGEGNSNFNPLFANEMAGNLQLSRCSPAINAGAFTSATVDIATDVFGRPRVVGSKPDFGAYEFQTSPVVLYVHATASGNNDGTSWANAFRSLQDALSFNCPNASEIWVARGTYTPTTNTNRDSSFRLRNNLAIYGGFAGTETQLSQRNWRLNQTILSGDIGVVGNRSDNSQNVISNDNNGLNATAILDGFIIRDGQYDKSGSSKKGGGGMLNSNSSPLVRNCIFVSNFSSSDGGAVFNQGASAAPTFINCVFSGNEAVFGGGIYNAVARTQVINCTFSSNQAAAGGGLFSTGIPADNPRATVHNSILWGNTDGIINASYVSQSSQIEVSNSLVQGGYTGNGNITGNIALNPLFVRQVPIGLGQWGDLRLLSCSPAINVGSNAALPAGTTTDLAGFARTAFTTVDMGAYERQSIAVPQVIYVDETASGNNDGTSWANAYRTLQAAANDLNNCATGSPTASTPAMHMAKGTYLITPELFVNFDRLGAHIIGGFPNGGGTRNAAVNAVVIRGNVQVLKSVTIDGVRVEKVP
jgi:subtilisin family serine protease